MKRVMALGVAAVGLFVWLEVGAAQQASMVSFNATSATDLRNWDQFVTVQERAGTLRVIQIERDPSLPVRTVERLQQYHQGVPVWGAEVVRDSDGGVPISIFGELSAAFTLDTQPGLTPALAGQTILSRAPSGAALLRPVDLVVLRVGSGEHHLAYTSVVSGGNRVNRVFVDAISGAELSRYSSIQTQSAVGTGRGVVGDDKKMSVRLQAGAYLADDDLRPPVLTTFDMRGSLNRALFVLVGAPLFVSDIAVDSDNNWTDVAAVDAHTHVGWTYDYYFKRHGRRGLDNRDRPLISLINGVTQQDSLNLDPEDFGFFAVNAFWCDSCGPAGVGTMYFGNGFPLPYVDGLGRNWTYLAGSLDVVTHEMTHGVISSSSNLLPENEPGALNEAFADIMGTSAEFFFQPPGSGLGQADYLIAEDSVRTRIGGLSGIRSLVNPQAFGDPDHYSIRETGPEDEGGVHANSTIPSHAFYLAVEGGRNRVSGVSVQGVGAANREQIERAFYRAFVFLLPASADFSTARAATVQAARDLYGANSAAALAITQAWTAVGVD
jgi:Zn-dependent metalloprotease